MSSKNASGVAGGERSLRDASERSVLSESTISGLLSGEGMAGLSALVSRVAQMYRMDVAVPLNGISFTPNEAFGAALPGRPA